MSHLRLVVSNERAALPRSQSGQASWKHLVVWPFIFAAACAAPFIEWIFAWVDAWLAR